VRLEIDSSGGELTALEHFLYRLGEWRQTWGLSLETTGLVQAASAAAILISLGDHGRRRTYANTSLLYHYARVETQGFRTAIDLQRLAALLRSTDAHIIRRLADHGWADRSEPIVLGDATLDATESIRLPAVISTRDELFDAYRKVFAVEAFIPPSLAKDLLLIDRVL
jgi:hypothetical protein